MKAPSRRCRARSALVGAAAATLVIGVLPFIGATVAAAATVTGSSTLVNGVPAVVPQPSSETAGTGGTFTLDSSTTVITTGDADAGVSGVANYLAGLVRPASGLSLPVSTGNSDATDAIVLDSTGPASLGDEGYTLTSDSDAVVITAHTAAGLFHGVQTLRQLLPAAVEDATLQSKVSWTVPSVNITDTPRYSYRGVMVDTGRHFFTVTEIERIIDQAAMYKLNVLHLHLTEDIGWRLAISAYPDLTTIGSNLSGGPGYYTQADYKAIVAYAAARYIQVIPEVDGPAHATAAVTSMATGTDSADIPIDPANTADNANVDTFLTNVISEISALSPSPYFHVGGDESSLAASQYDHWVTSAADAAVANGKVAMGWSQIGADPDMPAGSILQYWSTSPGHDSGDGLKQGLSDGDKLVLSPDDVAYFDFKYDASTPRGATYGGYTPLSKAYNWDPATTTANILAANGLTDTITTDPTLGVEAALWTDTLAASDTGDDNRTTYADLMLLPRLPALAEVGWSPESTHDWTNFSQRVATQGPRWTNLGYGFYVSPEITWPGFVTAPALVAPAPGTTIAVSPTVIDGTGTASDTVAVTLDGATLCTATVTNAGTWSCALPRPLTGGTHTVGLVQHDGDGNQSKPVSTTFTIGAPSALDDWKFDAISSNGSAVTDIAGGHNGTLTGSAKVVAGKVGDAISFDGTNSPVTTGLGDLPAPWSLGVWVNPGATETSANLISGANSAIKLQQYPSSGKVGITQFNVADYTSTYTPPLNAWTYLTLVDDGTKTVVYANGAAVSTINASIPLGRANIGSTGKDPAVEELDEVSAFSGALTADQVATLYGAAATGGTGGLPGLVDDWPMSASGGTTLVDSAFGGNATLTGTTALVDGKVGKAASFDGSASPITTSLADVPAPWSVGVWVNPTAKDSSANILSGTASSLKLQQFPSTGQVGITRYHAADYTSGYAAPRNTWTYLTVVDDGTATTVYANGAKVGSIAASVPLGRTNIGSTSSDPAHEQLDELAVFGSALTANEVRDLYGSAGTGGIDAGDLGWGPAAGGVYALATDGSDCHLTVNGNATVSATTVSVDGTSDQALCLGGDTSLGGTVTVQGGVRNQNGAVPVLKTGAPAVADPLGNLAAPSAPAATCPGAACQDGTNFNSGQTYELRPGTYTTGLNINSGATVCLAPGTYVLKAGWNVNAPLYEDGSAACPAIPAGSDDAGVLLYETSGHLQLNSHADLSGLQPVQAGAYAGLLYWQTDSDATSVNDGAALPGGWYEPAGSLTLNGQAAMSAPYVIASTITVNGGASLTVADPMSSYNDLSYTPPMGWNDWDYFQCGLSESLILQQAQALISTGMAAAGYDYVNLDDCWMQTGRDANGNLQADPSKFPHGIPWLANQVHAMGLKFGIYVDSGTSTCGGYAGSQGYEAQDAKLFASWGVDFIKVDGCNVRIAAGQTKLQAYEQIYAAWSKALIDAGRPMVFSASLPAYFQGSSDWNTSIAYTSGIANLWREGTDAAYPTAGNPGRWNSIMNNYHYNVGVGAYTNPAANAGPGHFNDPDFLVTGGPNLTDAEMQSQILLWAEMAAPLISSTDLTKLTDSEIAMLTNKKVIAVDQDPLGIQGTIVASGTNDNVLAKPLAGGDVAIVLFNSGTSTQTIAVPAATVGLASGTSYTLTDLVSGSTSAAGDTISASVPAHGAVMYRAHADTPGLPDVLASASSAAPAIGKPATVVTKLTNVGSTPVSAGSVGLTVPSGWTVTPGSQPLGTLAPGASVYRMFQVTRSGSTSGTVSATATATFTYAGGAGDTVSQNPSVTVTSVNPYATLPAAFDNVGITTVGTTTAGDIDGGGDSYSGEQLATVGLAPGATVTAQGATFTWPDVTPGTGPDNVVAAGQTINVSGQGSHLAFLGTGISSGTSSGTFTVTYSDGTTTTGTIGFPNWTVSPPSTQYGAVPVFSVNGRDTPSGFANQNYTYYIYYNAVPIDPSKTVASVTFPTAGGVHVFAISVQ